MRAELDQHGMPSLEKMDAAWTYLLEADKLGDLGAMTLSGRYDNGYQCDVAMKPQVFMYGVYQAGRLGAVGMMQKHMEKDQQAESGDSGAAPDEGGGETQG